MSCLRIPLIPFWLALSVAELAWLALFKPGSSAGVVREHRGWGNGSRADGGIVWGQPARKRKHLKAWCRENGMPLGQMECDVKAYFSEQEKRT